MHCEKEQQRAKKHMSSVIIAGHLVMACNRSALALSVMAPMKFSATPFCHLPMSAYNIVSQALILEGFSGIFTIICPHALDGYMEGSSPLVKLLFRLY